MKRRNLKATLKGITSKAELMSQLSTQLGFPEYFGANWDALYDCLTDFGWLHSEVREVVLHHEDIPQLGADELITYRELLRQAAQQWEEGDTKVRLITHFPRGHEGR